MTRKFGNIELHPGAIDLNVQIVLGTPEEFQSGEAEVALTVPEASMLLGVSSPRLMQLVKARQILPRKIWRGSLLFKRDDVIAFHLERRRENR